MFEPKFISDTIEVVHPCYDIHLAGRREEVVGEDEDQQITFIRIHVVELTCGDKVSSISHAKRCDVCFAEALARGDPFARFVSLKCSTPLEKRKSENCLEKCAAPFCPYSSICELHRIEVQKGVFLCPQSLMDMEREEARRAFAWKYGRLGLSFKDITGWLFNKRR